MYTSNNQHYLITDNNSNQLAYYILFSFTFNGLFHFLFKFNLFSVNILLVHLTVFIEYSYKTYTNQVITTSTTNIYYGWLVATTFTHRTTIIFLFNYILFIHCLNEFVNEVFIDKMKKEKNITTNTNKILNYFCRVKTLLHYLFFLVFLFSYFYLL